MSDATNDRVEGAIEELKGRGQKAWSELTNDEEKKVEGEMSKAVGKLKRAEADAKDEIDETVKDWTDQ
jgi:uncharacterized protein YjbJ (UPF0337 family)